MAVWWTTQVECASALSRRLADGTFDLRHFDQSVDRLAVLLNEWTEEQPSHEMRMLAEHFLGLHRLKTADALQLAAALQWCDKLRTAAAMEVLGSPASRLTNNAPT